MHIERKNFLVLWFLEIIEGKLSYIYILKISLPNLNFWPLSPSDKAQEVVSLIVSLSMSMVITNKNFERTKMHWFVPDMSQSPRQVTLLQKGTIHCSLHGYRLCGINTIKPEYVDSFLTNPQIKIWVMVKFWPADLELGLWKKYFLYACNKKS